MRYQKYIESLERRELTEGIREWHFKECLKDVAKQFILNKPILAPSLDEAMDRIHEVAYVDKIARKIYDIVMEHYGKDSLHKVNLYVDDIEDMLRNGAPVVHPVLRFNYVAGGWINNFVNIILDPLFCWVKDKNVKHYIIAEIKDSVDNAISSVLSDIYKDIEEQKVTGKNISEYFNTIEKKKASMFYWCKERGLLFGEYK